MPELADKIADAKAALALLERMAAHATCSEIGHDWQCLGGANCGCQDGTCSVPVHECARCKDCDYGRNEEADEVRRRCFELQLAAPDDDWEDRGVIEHRHADAPSARQEK